jgi:hypothetical protein
MRLYQVNHVAFFGFDKFEIETHQRKMQVSMSRRTTRWIFVCNCVCVLLHCMACSGSACSSKQSPSFSAQIQKSRTFLD